MYRLRTRGAKQNRFMVFFFFLCFLFMASFSTGCAGKRSGEQVSETRLLMDTYCTITIHGNSDPGLLDEAFKLCEELEKLFSITIEGSDVWRINNSGGEPVTVDSRTIDVLKAGLEFGDLSDGMLDITIGRLSRLWDFGSERIKRGDGLPVSSELVAAITTIDYANVRIDGNMVQLINPDAWIDLGAIAKGYIADKIAGLFMEQGVSGALIDLGGDTATVGNRPGGDPWRIALRKPFGSMEEWVGIVEVSGAAVVSSGTYERQFEVDGIIYHHILDPFTGMPVETDVVSATVVAEQSIIGEGLSTIAVLAGSKKTSDLFDRVPGFLGAVLVLDNGDVLVFGDIQFTKR